MDPHAAWLLTRALIVVQVGFWNSHAFAVVVGLVAFVVLLYLFIWRIVRTGSRDLRVPQESFILAPSATGGVKPAIPRLEPSGRLVVVKSGDLAPGRRFELDSAVMTVGAIRAETGAARADRGPARRSCLGGFPAPAPRSHG